MIQEMAELVAAMPYIELLLHLKTIGDAVASRKGDRLVTDLGHEYVRSAEGHALVHCVGGPAWEAKYIWCRV